VVYALDDAVTFDPMDLELALTPDAVAHALHQVRRLPLQCIQASAYMDGLQREYLRALVLAVRLSEPGPLAAVYNGIPPTAVELVGRDLPRPYLDRVLRAVAAHTEGGAHLEYNLRWVSALLGPHAVYLRQHRAVFGPTLRALRKALQEQRDGLGRLADGNRFALNYLLARLERHTDPTTATPTDSAVADEAETTTAAADGPSPTNDGDDRSDHAVAAVPGKARQRTRPHATKARPQSPASKAAAVETAVVAGVPARRRGRGSAVP
jgi:periodic tryptophan protein 2